MAICEAYLHYLHCGLWDEFYRHLWDNHGISRQKCALNLALPCRLLPPPRIAASHRSTQALSARKLVRSPPPNPRRLETMDHPIRSAACHLPHLIPSFKHFLWVLKITHSGANLDTAMEFSKASAGARLGRGAVACGRWRLRLSAGGCGP